MLLPGVDQKGVVFAGALFSFLLSKYSCAFCNANIAAGNSRSEIDEVLPHRPCLRNITSSFSLGNSTSLPFIRTEFVKMLTVQGPALMM